MQDYKKLGFLQSPYAISAVAKEDVGTLRIDKFGNKYRYAKAGAVALSPGKNTTAPALNADWVNESVAEAVAVGGKQVKITHVAVGADVLAENYFRGGQLHINDAAGEGHWYRIDSSSEVTATSTELTLNLEEGIKVALTTSSEATPVPSPYMGTVISATITDRPTGVPLVDVTALYYYWSLTSGEGVYLSGATTPAVGASLILGTTDGSLDTELVLTTAAVNVTSAPIAIATGTAGVEGEYKPCNYHID